jgi:hypothetical protein
LVAVTYLVAQVAMFLERRRRGVARTLHAVGAVVLAVAAFIFHSRISADRVLLAYWIPAVLGLAAAMALQRGHQRESEARRP